MHSTTYTRIHTHSQKPNSPAPAHASSHLVVAIAIANYYLGNNHLLQRRTYSSLHLLATYPATSALTITAINDSQRSVKTTITTTTYTPPAYKRDFALPKGLPSNSLVPVA